VRAKFRALLDDLEHVWLNRFVNAIPFWTIRRFFYRCAGMKIGKGSRILLGVMVFAPKGIVLGDRSTVNELAQLDGRGGLEIKNDVSISIRTVILTAGHAKNSSTFQYRTGKVVFEDNVWTGAGAIVLDMTTLGEGCILSAGSVCKGVLEPYGIYAGNPAVKVGVRNLAEKYHLDWDPFFR
jgi:acetyltransferase-like isoleucine patch superfamily enzyme